MSNLKKRSCAAKGDKEYPKYFGHFLLEFLILYKKFQ